MDVPRDPFYRKELDLRLSMSYGPGRYDPEYEENGRDYPFAYVRWTEQRNMESFLYLVSTGAVTPSRLVTHRFPIDRALDAYGLLEVKPRPADGPPQRYLGIVLEYPESETATARQRTIQMRPAGAAPAVSGNTLGIGFIGAGNFAKSVLLPALSKREDVQLIGLSTATGASGSETGKKHGFSYATTDTETLLADEKVHAVFVATRHSSHAKFARRALAAGKHVFVEKPLCIDRRDLASF